MPMLETISEILGAVDVVLAVDVNNIGASEDELHEARMSLENDEALPTRGNLFREAQLLV